MKVRKPHSVIDCYLVLAERGFQYLRVIMKIKIKLLVTVMIITWESCKLKRDTAIRTKLWEYKERA